MNQICPINKKVIHNSEFYGADDYCGKRFQTLARL